MSNKIIIGDKVYDGAYNITSGQQSASKSLDSVVLTIDVLDFDIRTDDRSIINTAEGTKLTYFHDENQRGIYYVESVEQIGTNIYHVYANSAIVLLDSLEHKGGIYTGQTVKSVVEDICGPLKVYIKSDLAVINLYGWLPYVKPPDTSARDNLAQVLFAIGAYLGTDLDGILRVEPLWDGVISEIVPGRIDIGSSVERGRKITAVSVAEHQYVQGSESKELFSGTTQNGDVISFDEPMHSLSAVGFNILESGANWAKVSAGNGTLTGKAYIHTTRQVTEKVADGAENIKTIKDATLVSLVNSQAVAKRLADYYRCTETIKAPVVAGAERPGHVVSIYHPYDRKMVHACIASADITMSAKLKSDLTALVGFKPPQPEQSQYYDERVVLTGSGTWTWPPGVTTATRALIGAGQGGKCGKAGEKGGNGSGASAGNGGAGGEGGTGGRGGMILFETITVTPGTSVSYSCGVGGNGAPFSADNPDAEGTSGGDTTFGDSSSASGQVSAAGFVDPITSEVFGRPGDTGVNGGAGGKGGHYVSGVKVAAAAGESVPPASGGPGGSFKYGPDGVYAAGGAGGGAAAGANGSGGGNGSTQYVDDIFGQGPGYVATPGGGGKGASAAITPAQAESFGAGGRGGDGGGGGGGSGAGVAKAVWGSSGGAGGNGSAGGKGGDGGIILYFHKPKPQAKSGPIVTRDGKWLLDRLIRKEIV